MWRLSLSLSSREIYSWKQVDTSKYKIRILLLSMEQKYNLQLTHNKMWVYRSLKPNCNFAQNSDIGDHIWKVPTHCHGKAIMQFLHECATCSGQTSINCTLKDRKELQNWSCYRCYKKTLRKCLEHQDQQWYLSHLFSLGLHRLIPPGFILVLTPSRIQQNIILQAGPSGLSQEKSTCHVYSQT